LIQFFFVDGHSTLSLYQASNQAGCFYTKVAQASTVSPGILAFVKRSNVTPELNGREVLYQAFNLADDMTCIILFIDAPNAGSSYRIAFMLVLCFILNAIRSARFNSILGLLAQREGHRMLS
jgi:hypothetical protein